MNLIPTIGIEMHCEMKSKSKVFSTAQNTFSKNYNTHVAPNDLAFPGTLPQLNKECLKKAIQAALILNCKVPEYMVFDRKNYYYPDLPKGYQITQFHHPVGSEGAIKVPFQDKTLDVVIHDIHLEEDTAQMEHLEDISLINYNRCGIPLLELVTGPCFHSKEEVLAFLEYVRRIYQYADISDADASKGQIRCDVNISLSENDTLGTRVEVKNVNSFSNVAMVIDYEIDRQKKLIENGKTNEIDQASRRWDEKTFTTIRMRDKADAIDYNYFVEPNIPKIKISKGWIQELKESLPKLPLERLETYQNDYELTKEEANILLKDKNIADFFEACIHLKIIPKVAYNWITGPILSYLNKEEITIQESAFQPAYLQIIIDKITDQTISSKQAKEILQKSLQERKDPKEFMNSENAQISDVNELTKIIDEIIEANPNQLEAYKNGRTNLFEFFIGQVMKNTKGKANPVMTREILQKKIN